jgi:hypothetical protein
VSDNDGIDWVTCLHVGTGQVPEYARIRARGTDHEGQPVSLDMIACAHCAEIAVEKLSAKIQDDTELSLLIEGKEQLT